MAYDSLAVWLEKVSEASVICDVSTDIDTLPGAQHQQQSLFVFGLFHSLFSLFVFPHWFSQDHVHVGRGGEGRGGEGGEGGRGGEGRGGEGRGGEGRGGEGRGGEGRGGEGGRGGGEGRGGEGRGGEGREGRGGEGRGGEGRGGEGRGGEKERNNSGLSSELNNAICVCRTISINFRSPVAPSINY